MWTARANDNTNKCSIRTSVWVLTRVSRLWYNKIKKGFFMRVCGLVRQPTEIRLQEMR